MEAAEVPSVNLPPPDLEREIDELKCDVGIRQAWCSLDARAAHMLKCKTEVIVAEIQQTTQGFVEEAEKVCLIYMNLANIP